mgnify:CR=1 FL=1
MFLFIKPAPDTQKKPVIVIVGSTVAKKATDRNLIRRRVRAIITPIAKARKKSFVAIAKPEAKKASFYDLKSEIDKQLTIDITL